MINKIDGTGVALVTPFNLDFSIDFISLSKLINYVIDGGVDFLVILGTTGESPSISIKEKQDIINFTVKVNDKRLPIVVGIGGNNTLNVENEFKILDLNGIDAILSVTPYYNKPSQLGLYLHFKRLSEVSSLPIILYNVPSRTGVNLDASTCLRLANEFENIIAIKEASGNLNQIDEIINNMPSGFSVLSGDDALTVKMIFMGAIGVISVIGQSHPKEFSSMVSSALNNDESQALKIHKDLEKFYHFLYSEGNPSGIKALLSYFGLCNNILRLPLTNISNKLHTSLKLILK
ncbi:4-hydroxy-tetrahydrodipicolinate synthase [Flavobacteriales bacterium]|jgi:4-hydroxy-tetrahydrodipicolinate synthase|nr:4-hydroxy-tetrahydrodipicolinate synthase [Flavobacteriales bacterium]|tara:strand:+ start:59730 stop:60602 length:873 start_codon:yes stop_codon:yes gene_type:complete